MKLENVKNLIKAKSDKIGNNLVDTGTDLMTNEHAAGASIITGVIGAVIAISFMANALPSAYSSWLGATATGGTMETASTGDKAIWNLGGLVIVGGAIMVIVGMFFKSKA